MSQQRLAAHATQKHCLVCATYSLPSGTKCMLESAWEGPSRQPRGGPGTRVGPGWRGKCGTRVGPGGGEKRARKASADLVMEQVFSSKNSSKNSYTFSYTFSSKNSSRKIHPTKGNLYKLHPPPPPFPGPFLGPKTGSVSGSETRFLVWIRTVFRDPLPGSVWRAGG